MVDLTGDVVVRRSGREDFPQVLALARRSLGWTDADARFLEWKHLENPFGESPMWVAEAGERIVGFRTLLRWELVAPTGRVITAVRAVDTATDPEFQGRGIFTRLTRTAVDALRDEGVDLIFNTPNAKSLAGYLKMGWHELGRLAVSVMPTSVRFPVVIGTARTAAGREAIPTLTGEPAGGVLADSAALERLLTSLPPAAGITTLRTPALLAWRYGNPDLGYRVAMHGTSVEDGLAVFRRRRRGRAVEAVLCDVLAPGGEARVEHGLTRQVARLADADYLLRLDRRVMTLDPFFRFPRVGPVLACRRLDGSPPPALGSWALAMGDVELF